MNSLSFKVINLGCRVNRVESDVYMVALEALGAICSDNDSLDLIIVNTCAVTSIAEKKTRKTIRRALRDFPNAKLVLTGCASALNPESYEQMDVRVVCVPKFELGEMLETSQGLAQLLLLSGIEGAQNITFGCAAEDGSSPLAFCGMENGDVGIRHLRIGDKFPTRVGIKVQDGCNNACTFCIVHKARGRQKSRDLDAVLNEVKLYEAAGVREIVLTGINIGSYDFIDAGGNRVEICGLLRALLANTSECRFRISSIEPRNVSRELLELMCQAQGRVARQLHLPLQSGSQDILRDMHRPYSADYFKKLVSDIYYLMPDFSISTDVIVGFPGESDADFEETMQVSALSKFTKMHIFPYSKREGTPAAKREDQVSGRVIDQRMERISKMAQDMRRLEFERRFGKCEKIITELDGRAMTESHFEIRLPESREVGQLIDFVITKDCELLG